MNDADQLTPPSLFHSPPHRLPPCLVQCPVPSLNHCTTEYVSVILTHDIIFKIESKKTLMLWKLVKFEQQCEGNVANITLVQVKAKVRSGSESQTQWMIDRGTGAYPPFPSVCIDLCFHMFTKVNVFIHMSLFSYVHKSMHRKWDLGKLNELCFAKIVLKRLSWKKLCLFISSN